MTDRAPRQDGHAGMPPSYFSWFDLEPRFALPLEQLDLAYRTLASRVHPDRFANGTATERRQALELATRANEAYRTLKTPVLRARHLLALRGIDLGATGASVPPAFLNAQIDRREALGDARAARDETALRALGAAVREHAGNLSARLAAQLDTDRNDAGAVDSVLQLMFLDKLIADVDDARDELEA
jgi:molecular chaperone HscB